MEECKKITEYIDDCSDACELPLLIMQWVMSIMLVLSGAFLILLCVLYFLFTILIPCVHHWWINRRVVEIRGVQEEEDAA